MLRLMADFAIRDQMALIEALTPSSGPTTDEINIEAITHARACISDFKAFVKILH